MSVVNLLPVEYSYSVEAISDTPIFNALAATTAPFSPPSATRAARDAQPLLRDAAQPAGGRRAGTAGCPRTATSFPAAGGTASSSRPTPEGGAHVRRHS